MTGMNRTFACLADTEAVIRWTATLLVLMAWQVNLFAQDSGSVIEEPKAGVVSVNHVLGLEGIKKGARGTLSIANNALQFKTDGEAAVELRIASIQFAFTGQDDKQVGGIPLVVGRAATPYGGGRLIALFSHKKYDSLTVQYRDDDGGAHGAVFRLARGQARALRDELVANGLLLADVQTIQSKVHTGEQK